MENIEEQLTPLQARELEVQMYTNNIDTYTRILSNLNDEWDADLLHLKDVEVQEAARQCSMERLERLAELQLHRQLQNLLKTEIVERFKAQSILNDLKGV